MQSTHGKWAARFIWAAVAQGLFAVIWTLFVIDPYQTPSPAMVIASGSAGTWFTLGYILYLVVGVIAIGLTALFYYYIEDVLGKAYTGVSNVFAWLHFALMNVGVAASTWLLMYAGYVGGAALLPARSGGGNMTAFQVHTQILQYYVNPIGYVVAIAAVGAIFGGLGYLVRSRKR